MTLRPTNSAHVLAEVRSGTAQLGFVEGAQAPVDLPWQAVAHDELVAVVAPGHPWARRRGRLRAADLVAEPLVCREVGSGTRQVLDEALRAQGHPPVTPLLELGTATAVREAVRAGGAAAVLSRLAVADDLAGHRLIALDVEDLDLRRTLRAVWVSGHQPPQGPARDLLALTTRRPHHPRRTPASTV
ncbi:LysR substrate-binding domain-containing protein [Pseudokineococcus sp. 1T1Z-3]|uniref:LysR substrate-binding domain-containing protein n=1 Tax=Pseudokineococcus sp. 1T1Z-3 TaxID=3132745 RepID=UPI00403FC205